MLAHTSSAGTSIFGLSFAKTITGRYALLAGHNTLAEARAKQEASESDVFSAGHHYYCIVLLVVP